MIQHSSSPSSSPTDNAPMVALFGALADPVRLSIVQRLAEEGELHVGAIAEQYDISAPAISRHLSVLEKSGLVKRRIEKQWRLCALDHERLNDLDSWLTFYKQYWTQSLDRLEELMRQTD